MTRLLATLLARLLLRYLRSVEPRTLRVLKAQLEMFNARTGVWK